MNFNPILVKLAVMHDLGWWLVGKPMVDFLFALIGTFFVIYHSSGVMRRNVYSLAVFAGGQPLSLNFCLDRVVTQQPFLPSESYRHWAIQCWRPHRSAFRYFDTILECDRRPADRFAVTYAMLAKLCCKSMRNVKKNQRESIESVNLMINTTSVLANRAVIFWGMGLCSPWFYWGIATQ